MTARATMVAVVVAVGLQVALAVSSAAGAPEGAAANLVQAGRDGPAAAVLTADFGDDLPPGLGHDGQQNYAIARDPWPPSAVAPHLDRPRYRLQRPLLPFLAWLLHPTGGGPGLVWAFVVVDAGALVLLGWAVLRLAVRFGAPPLLAVLVVLLPLAYYPLRITVSDALALALVLVAADAHLADRPWRAALFGTLGVLAKESMLLVPAGLWLARRDRRSLPVVAVPAAVAVALAVVLRLTVDASGPSVVELVAPFQGLWDSARTYWRDGENLPAAVSVVAGLGLGVAALATKAGRAHPLAPALALQVAFTTVLGADVIGLLANGTRTTGALQVLAILVAASPSVRGRPAAAADGEA